MSQSLLQLPSPAQDLPQAQGAAESVVRAQALELDGLGSHLSSAVDWQFDLGQVM